jgi:hypothetical protein
MELDPYLFIRPLWGTSLSGAHGDAVGWDAASRVTGSVPNGVTGIFHWLSFRPHYGPGVDSATDRNEYQEYFLEVKVAVA